MKQEATAVTPPLETKLARPSSKVKDLINDRAQSVLPDIKNSGSKAVRRPLWFGRPKSGDGLSRTMKGREAEEPRVAPGMNGAARKGPTRRSGPEEQLVRPRRVKAVDGVEEKWRREMKEKVEMSENLIKNLECEVSVLRAELQKVRGFNAELELKNQKLSSDLATAKDNISALSTCDLQREKESNRECQSSKFKDIQKLIASKLENPKAMKVGPTEASYSKPSTRVELPASPIARAVESLLRSSPPPCASHPPLPPPLPPGPSPPPPPPPPLPASKPRARNGAVTQKPPAVVEFYQFW